MNEGKQRAARLLQQKRAGQWYAQGARFRCLAPACSHCCSGARGPGYVWITPQEMLAAARHMGLAFDEFTRRYVRQVGTAYSLVEQPNYDCVFLDGHLCRIYDARPTQCRAYPFWHDIMASRETFLQEARHCPGIETDETTVAVEDIDWSLAEYAAVRKELGVD
jgi:uncharacterized protein